MIDQRPARCQTTALTRHHESNWIVETYTLVQTYREKAFGFGGRFLRVNDSHGLESQGSREISLESTNQCKTRPLDATRLPSNTGVARRASTHNTTQGRGSTDTSVETYRVTASKLISTSSSKRTWIDIARTIADLASTTEKAGWTHAHVGQRTER